MDTNNPSEKKSGPQALSGSASAFHVMIKDDTPGHLYFWTREEWSGDVPSDQHELQVAFDDVCAVLRARFAKRDPEKFRHELGRLLNLARAAFAGDVAQVPNVWKSLEAYKSEIVREEGSAIKNEYLKELAISAVIASILILITASLIRIGTYFGEEYGLISTLETSDGAATVAMSSARWSADFSPLHFGFLLSATMWGIWLSFVIRNMNLRFEQLQHLESDLMRPWSRLLAFGLLAFILALFFQMKVLVISIGGVSTSQISENALVALFVGLCLGFTDKALPGEVQRRIDEFFQSAKKGTET